MVLQLNARNDFRTRADNLFAITFSTKKKICQKFVSKALRSVGIKVRFGSFFVIFHETNNEKVLKNKENAFIYTIKKT